MAAPAATFRWLLPRGRPLLSRPGLAAAAAALRPYGVRVSDTGELVTHTGQVSARGPVLSPLRCSGRAAGASHGCLQGNPGGAASSALVRCDVTARLRWDIRRNFFI